MAKSKAHPGFKGAVAAMGRKNGKSAAANAAILAASTRKAVAKNPGLLKSNPRLGRVSGVKKGRK